jgi:hypothetical protein
MVENNMNLHSLRPYLDPVGAHFCLKFPLIAEDASILEKSLFPFVVISDSDPLNRLIEARFVTDAGHEFKKVFLLVQRDQCRLANDDLWPMNNHDIEQSWQKAFSLYSRESQKRSAIALAHQMDHAGGITPLHSLFFCKKRQVFFHPPCPHCGLPLHQCYDDALLSSLGFQSYSASLKRYLFCPSCFASKGISDFYVYELEGSDPSTLKNRWDLIKGFGLLLDKKERVDHFPCLECPDKGDCYGAAGAVVSRIAPFSFYPFYMLIFEAMSLNALDFLSLISGAPFEELEARLRAKGELGRIGCLNEVKQDRLVKAPFLFDRDERYFVEVLYLKLSFLGELIRFVFSSDQDAYKHPDLRLSLDRIWVSLPEHDGLLPFFWDFNVTVMDIMRNPHEATSFPKAPPSYGLHFLSLVWFYALLVNSKQDIAQVYRSIGEAIDKLDSDGQSSFKNIIAEGSIETFLPDNIFWSPEGKTLPENWNTLWERSLSLGWSLLRATLYYDSEWSKEEFSQQLEALREEVKKSLFQERSGYVRDAYPSEAKEIYTILTTIVDKWRSRIEVEKEEELAETVVMSPGDFQKETAIPEVKVEERREEALAETVVLSREDFQKKAGAPTVEEAKKEEELAETVVLSPGGFAEKVAAPDVKGKEAGEEELAETVVIAPQEVSTKLKAGKKTPEEPSEDDFFAETIVLSSDKIEKKDREETNE